MLDFAPYFWTELQNYGGGVPLTIGTGLATQAIKAGLSAVFQRDPVTKLQEQAVKASESLIPDQDKRKLFRLRASELLASDEPVSREEFCNALLQDGFAPDLAGQLYDKIDEEYKTLVRGSIAQNSKVFMSATTDKLIELGQKEDAILQLQSVMLSRLLESTTSNETAHALMLQRLEEIFKRLESLSAKPISFLHQLPSPPADFTGRTAELAELLAAVKDGGATISGLRGMGGIGKTALALVLAQRLKDKYPDAQFFIDLKGARQKGDVPLTPAQAMAKVIQEFYPKEKLPEDEAQLNKIYCSVLDGKRVLLLMDNALDDKQVQPLIPPPGSLLLVTSRQHFHLPGLFCKNLDTLPEKDACALLCKIAPRIGDKAGEIAKLCDYLPLALRLAATALADRADISPVEYLKRLGDAKQRLSLVEASLALSYDLLSPELQRFWRMLAVFPDSFDHSAAAAVWWEDLEKADDAKDRLSDLLARSLMEWDETTGRYRLHDLARLFADAQLSKDEPEKYQAQFRHAEHYKNVLAAAKELYKKGGDQIMQGLKLFDAEWINIQAGQAWAAANAVRDKAAAKFCNAYPDAGAHILGLRLHPRDWINWLEAALTAARQLQHKQAEGVHLGNLGTVYAALGEPRRAIEYLEQNLAIAREIGDRRGEGNALGNLGLVYADLGEPRRAIEYYEQRLVIAREIGDRRGEGQSLGNRGAAYAALGEPRRAIEYYEQDLVIAREIGDRRGEGAALGNLGAAYFDLGEPRRAIEYFEQHLAIAREIGDRRGEGQALGNLGSAYLVLGEPRRAIEYYEQTLIIHREIGDRRGEGQALGNLGNAYANLGEPRRAIEYYEQALLIAREIGDLRDEATDLYNMSLALDVLGKRAEAIKHAEAALLIREQIEDPHAARVREKLKEWKGQSS